MDSFLAIAEELQLKGLMGKSEKDEVVQKDTFQRNPTEKEKGANKNELSAINPFHQLQSYSGEQMATNTFGGEVVLTSHFPSGDLQELDEKCITMMEKTSAKNAHGQPLYRCKVCGKEKIIGNIKSHIESNHLEGFSIPCNFCGKTFRGSRALRHHEARDHK